jgi:Abnormal spindle-like microcephaly-assoc'd, ASPM-SPD-2-Hydin/NHL repeat
MLPAYVFYPTHTLLRRIARLVVTLLAFFAVQIATAQGPNITYTVKTTINHGLSFATSAAADSAGNVFVADIGTAALYKETLNPDGSYTQSTISTGAGTPYAVAIDSSNNLYVADGTHTVYKETLSGGSYTESTVANAFTGAYRVAVDSAGNVYVLDASTGTVYLEKLSGGSYTQSTVAAGLNVPNDGSGSGGIAVDSAGSVYIADAGNRRVLKETLIGGAYTQSVVMDSTTYQDNGTTVTPQGIAVDAGGAVIIANENYGVFKAVRNGATYTTAPVVFANASTIIAGVGASLDPHGNLYIVDLGTIYVNPANELAESSSAENFGSLNVGTAAPAQTATFTFDVGGTLAAIPYGVSTQGDLTLDFQAASTQAANVCVTGRTYNQGDTCTVAATFTPTRPGVRYGAIALFAPSGTPIATSYLQGIGVSPQVSFSPGDFGPTLGQTFGVSVAVDSSSNAIFGAIGAGIVLRSFTNAHPLDIVMTGFTTGYTGSNGYSVNNGNSFGNGYVVDGAGNIVLADGFTSASPSIPGATSFSAYDVNPTIAVPPTGTIQMIVTNYGTAFLASVPFTSTSVTPPANNRPAVDGAGNLYFADDNGNRLLEEQYIHGAYNKLLVVATSLNNPGDVVVDAAGDVFAADTGNNRIVKETPNGDGTYTQSVVDSGFAAPPEGLAIDRVGNLYVSLFNNFLNINVPLLVKETLANGAYTRSNLKLFGSEGIDVDPAGNVYAGLPASAASTFLSNITSLDVATPPSFIFAQTAVGSTSSDSPQTVTVVNNGNAPLNFATNPAITTGFTLSPGSTCSQSAALAPAASCTLLINFVPTQGGVTNGTLTLTDNHLGASGSTQVIHLNGQATGTGSLTATLSPSSYNYGSVNLGSSITQSFTLANTSTSSINIASTSLPNTLFTISGTTCGTSLAPSATCAYTIVFKPTAVGAQTATFSVADDAGTQSATLTGTGAQTTAAQATLTPGTGSFAATTVGTTSAATTFTLTNAGNAALSITSFGLSGANSSSFQQGASTCGSSLAAGASCTIAVIFAPSSAGTFSATLSVTDAVGTQSAALTGTGTAPSSTPDFTVTATPASQSVVSGGSATYNVLVASTGGTFAQGVLLTASGLPSGATATFSPASVTPGGSGAQSTMIVQTAAQQVAGRNGVSPWPFTAPVFAALLLLFPGRRFRLGKKGWGVFTSLACIAALLGIAASTIGCGAGFALPSSAKTYTITVTGASGSDTHSTTVTLTVQ